MRKSLYRAKRIDNGEWIYGDLLTPTDIMDVWEISENTGMGDRHEVDPDTIGQYTGRADKNGKMIFEGDYLGEHCSNDCGTWLSKYGVVTWWESDARYVLTDKEGIANDLTYEEAVAALHWDDLEVIGNIHDSPDLLDE